MSKQNATTKEILFSKNFYRLTIFMALQKLLAWVELGGFLKKLRRNDSKSQNFIPTKSAQLIFSSMKFQELHA